MSGRTPIEITVEPARIKDKERGSDWTIEINWNPFQVSKIDLTDEELIGLAGKLIVRLPDAIKSSKGKP